jgi:NADH-quinone oxidoreductase subunit L
MVVAGVYLVARSMSIFVGSAEASMFVALIGLITSLMAASIALVQNDIKRILAYSTVSQLGYMIMALGLYGYDTSIGHHSSGYYAGTFHLMTHAFFKGLLFLGAGSVIHAVHTNDIREMGGLWGKMKITAPAFCIASLSIAGIFPLAGFWSKDEIVASTLGHPAFMIGTLLIAFMTAFYMWRLCFLTFFGQPRDQHRFDHAHESPRSMSWPLAFLAVLTVGAGWVGLPWSELGFATFVYHGEPYHPHASWWLMIVSTIVALSGIGLAYLMYYKKSISAEAMGQRFKPIYDLLYNKYYFDELYDLILIRPIMAISRMSWKFDAAIIDGAVNGTGAFTIWWADMKMLFDKYIIDGAVNGAGWVVCQVGGVLRYLQTGAVQFYAIFIVIVIVMLTVLKFEYIPLGPEKWFIFGLVLLTLATVLLRFLKMSGDSTPAETTDED